MDSSSEAAVALFRLGPSTNLDRVLALRVLFCNHVRQALVAARGAAGARLSAAWRWLAILLGGLRRWLDPRSPNVILASVLAAALFLRRIRLNAAKAELAFRRKHYQSIMKGALTYEEWAHGAQHLDKINGRRLDSELYDEELVQAKLEELRRRRLEGTVEDIVFALRTDFIRNLGNMCNPQLHKGRLQTPDLIKEYINEVRLQLREVCETDSEEFPLEEKLAFIHETRHAFGRTALLLSGGAALGAFHLGVVRTLVEHRLLPRVVAGASVGSIICSFAATRTWTELQSFFDDPMPPMAFFESMGSIFATAHRLLTRGAMQDIGMLQRKMRQLIGDLTFQEAYDLSGRVLGISVSSMRPREPSRMLNYLTSPHVVIWSAVTASCAFPGLFEAQELMAKDRTGRLVPYHALSQVSPSSGDKSSASKEQATLATPSSGAAGLIQKREWRDGSLESDLPMKELTELFNVNHFIVSQANPHIAPLLRLKEVIRHYGGDRAAKLAHLLEMEVKHRCNQCLEMGFRLGGLAKLFAQHWEGDITIVMPATFAQFAKLIQNPTASELRKAVLQGRRCTWAKLSAIQANCGIELMLDECVSELNRRRNRLRASMAALSNSRRGSSFATKRIPSWNCLARESSWGSLDEEGMLDSTVMTGGGPWGGPVSGHFYRKRPVSSAVVDASEDADNSNNNSGRMASWSVAGGPLMRTPSGAMLALLLCENGQGEENNSRHGCDENSLSYHTYTNNDSPTLNNQNSWSARHLARANSLDHDYAASLHRQNHQRRLWDPLTQYNPSSPATVPESPLSHSLRKDESNGGVYTNFLRKEAGEYYSRRDENEALSFGLAMRSGMRSRSSDNISSPHSSSSPNLNPFPSSHFSIDNRPGITKNTLPLHKAEEGDNRRLPTSQSAPAGSAGDDKDNEEGQLSDSEDGTAHGGHFPGCSFRGRSSEELSGQSCRCAERRGRAVATSGGVRLSPEELGESAVAAQVAQARRDEAARAAALARTKEQTAVENAPSGGGLSLNTERKRSFEEEDVPETPSFRPSPSTFSPPGACAEQDAAVETGLRAELQRVVGFGAPPGGSHGGRRSSSERKRTGALEETDPFGSYVSRSGSSSEENAEPLI